MKAFFYAATFAILAFTPVFGAESVSLVGTWGRPEGPNRQG
jgi:hypothetical protein